MAHVSELKKWIPPRKTESNYFKMRLILTWWREHPKEKKGKKEKRKKINREKNKERNFSI